jgi:hypothetical protein
MSARYEVAVYYFPGYHRDPRCDAWHGDGWTEWELVRRAEARFEGHLQPRVPLWGYADESDPAVASRSIAAAVDHGVDAFIVDWYWYGGRPFLERALERGLMGSPDRRLKLALMWANHDWLNIHPRQRGSAPAVLEPGALDAAEFERATDYIIETYFGDDRYWEVDGGLYFSIYDLTSLLRGLGGIEGAAAALAGFRERVRRRLGRELHLNAVLVGTGILATDRGVLDPAAVLARLGFDSTTAYVALHHAAAHGDPGTDYEEFCGRALSSMKEVAVSAGLPFFPNATVGWDASPRTIQSDRFDDLGDYPFSAILTGATPDAFGRTLGDVLDWASEQGHRARPIVTVNAWNEWTEGSHLEPDERNGYGFLEQLRDRTA